MSADKTWTEYADENLAVARLAYNEGYWKAAVQNAQQAVEKYLKAALLGHGVPVPRSHSTELLNRTLAECSGKSFLTDDECELIDALYIPSKYPVGGAVPDLGLDESIVKRCVSIAESLKEAL